MGAEYKFAMVMCVAWCCMSVALSAAIPAHGKPLDPDHVPSSVCESMLPAHGSHASSLDPAPYTVTPSKMIVSPGETITVVVSGENDAVFRGIYLQARVLGSGAEAVGKFSLDNQLTNSAIRVSSCPPGSENAISYISRDPLNNLIFEWKAPETATGNIYFRSTIVQTYSLFWTNVDSEAVTISMPLNTVYMRRNEKYFHQLTQPGEAEQNLRSCSNFSSLAQPSSNGVLLHVIPNLATFSAFQFNISSLYGYCRGGAHEMPKTLFSGYYDFKWK